MRFERYGLQRIAGPAGDGELGLDVRFEFLRCAAAVADQESRMVVRPVQPTGHIGVQALDPMDESHAAEELERPINGRRMGRLAGLSIDRDQIVGLHRPVGAEEELQDTTSRSGKLLSGLGALDLCVPKRRPQFGELEPWAPLIRMVAHAAT